MKVLIQVVNNASVSVKEKNISKIGKGFLLFVSFGKKDNELIVEKMIEKILELRILEDEEGKSNYSILDKKEEILSVPQFTLYANCKKGRRPSFDDSLNYKEASKLFDFFNNKIKKKSNLKIKTGIFKEDMIISIENRGPFTILLDSFIDLNT